MKVYNTGWRRGSQLENLENKKWWWYKQRRYTFEVYCFFMSQETTEQERETWIEKRRGNTRSNLHTDPFWYNFLSGHWTDVMMIMSRVNTQPNVMTRDVKYSFNWISNPYKIVANRPEWFGSSFLTSRRSFCLLDRSWTWRSQSTFLPITRMFEVEDIESSEHPLLCCFDPSIEVSENPIVLRISLSDGSCWQWHLRCHRCLLWLESFDNSRRPFLGLSICGKIVDG